MNRDLVPLTEDEDDLRGDELDSADDIIGGMGHAAGSLEGRVAIRDAKWRELVAVAPFARANPPSVLKGTLGGQQSIIPGGPALQVAMWGGDDAETLPITVTFGVVLPPQPALSTGNVAQGRTYGIVKAGTRGFLLTAEVDVGIGTQFVISGSFVSLQVGCDPSQSGLVGGDPIQLAGMLSFWDGAVSLPPTRTRYIDALDHLAFQVVSVPPFAKNVSIWRTTMEACTVQFNDRNNFPLYSIAITAGQITLPPFQLSGDVAYILVSNPNLGPLSARLVFELGL